MRRIKFLFVNNPVQHNAYLTAHTFGMLSLASAITTDPLLCKKVDVRILLPAHLDEKEFLKRAEAFEPDYVSFALFESSLSETKKLISLVKNALPNARIVAFGHYATMEPVDSLVHAGADILFRGDAEKTLADFLKAVLEEKNGIAGTRIKKIPGLFLRKEGKVFSFRNEAPMLDEAELNGLEIDWALLRETEKSHGLAPCTLYVVSSRGCPNRCVFCSRAGGGKFRAWSAEKTVSEIERALRASPEKKLVCFCDESFLCDRDRIIELSKLFLETGLNRRVCVEFQAQVDSFFKGPQRVLDGELVRSLEALNPKMIELGVDSFCNSELRRLKKGNYSVEEVFALLGRLNSANAGLIAFNLIASNIHTSPEEFLENLLNARLVKKRFPKTHANLALFLYLYKGTEAYAEVKALGLDDSLEAGVELPLDSLVRNVVLDVNLRNSHVAFAPEEFADISALYEFKKSVSEKNYRTIENCVRSLESKVSGEIQRIKAKPVFERDAQRLALLERIVSRIDGQERSFE